jgi:hypothetical protein
MVKVKEVGISLATLSTYSVPMVFPVTLSLAAVSQGEIEGFVIGDGEGVGMYVDEELFAFVLVELGEIVVVVKAC